MGEKLVAVINDFNDVSKLNYYEIYKSGEIYTLVVFNQYGWQVNEIDFNSLGEALANA
jgi:hypothetical protein